MITCKHEHAIWLQEVNAHGELREEHLRSFIHKSAIKVRGVRLGDRPGLAVVANHRRLGLD